MIDKIFEGIYQDSTKYDINVSNLNELEKCTTAIQFSKMLDSCSFCRNSLIEQRRKFLDMQYFLGQVSTVKNELCKSAVTVENVFEYCKAHFPMSLEKIKKLIIIAVTEEYIVPKSDEEIA